MKANYSCKSLINMVPGAGLEPARCCHRRILRPFSETITPANTGVYKDSVLKIGHFVQFIALKTAQKLRNTYTHLHQWKFKMKHMIILILALLVPFQAQATKVATMTCEQMGRYCLVNDEDGCAQAKMSAAHADKLKRDYRRICVVPKVLPIILMDLLKDEPKKCYLTEDRLDRNGNWSGVNVEVSCG